MTRTAVRALSTSYTHDAHTEGAIEMARFWLRNPGRIGDTPYPQVCRELYTISRALVRLANQRGAVS